MTSSLCGTCAPQPPISALAGLEVVVEDGIVVVTLRGHLDAEVGEALGVATEGALQEEARRLDIDLRQVASFTVEGAAALRTCRLRAAGLREGLHYRTGRGPGREALLAAYPPVGIDD